MTERSPEPGWPNPDLAALLTGLRRAARLTQEELAERSGLGVRTIRQLERGTIRRPQRGTLDRIASGLCLDEATGRRLRAVANRADFDGRLALPPDLPPPVPAQVPAAPTPFVGRDDELARLDAVFAGPDRRPGAGRAPRIAVVTGPPGIGKSALARHWAHACRARFADGQIYLDLRGHLPDGTLTTDLAMNRVLMSLGFAAGQLPADPDALAAVYRSVLAARQALLLLDNTGPAPMLEALLPGSPGSAVLVTSRWRPDVLTASHQPHVIELGPLLPAESHTLLGHLLGTRRIAAEPRQVAALVRRCSGFPLALRLVAAPLATRPRLPVGELAGDAASESPSGGQASMPDAMRVALNASYRMVPPGARRALRLLAVHPGQSFTIDHATVLIGQQRRSVERALDELCAAHLLEESATRQYRFHDVIAEYARTRQVASETAAALDRLLRFYYALATAARAAIEPSRPALDGDPGPKAPAGIRLPHSEAEALAWLDADRPNLEPVVRLASTRHVWFAWRIARELVTYAERRALWAEYLPIARYGVDAAPDPLQAARMRLLLGVTLFYLGRVGAGADEIASAAPVFAEYGEERLLGRALNNLGWARTTQGDHQGAVEAYRRALKIQAGRRDLAGAGQVLTNIGDAYVAMGEFAQGLRYLRSALSVRRRYGTDRDVANALLNVGEWYALADGPEAALPYFRESLSIACAGGDRETEGLCRLSLGRAYADLSNVDLASEQLGAAAHLRRDTGNEYGEALALAHLAAAYAAHQDERAEPLARQVRQLCRRLPEAASRSAVEAVLHARRH